MRQWNSLYSLYCSLFLNKPIQIGLFLLVLPNLLGQVCKCTWLCRCNRINGLNTCVTLTLLRSCEVDLQRSHTEGCRGQCGQSESILYTRIHDVYSPTHCIDRHIARVPIIGFAYTLGRGRNRRKPAMLFANTPLVVKARDQQKQIFI